MTLEVWPRSLRGRRQGDHQPSPPPPVPPLLTVRLADRKGHLNSQAVAMLGDPARLLLLVDTEAMVIGFARADDDDDRAYRVTYSGGNRSGHLALNAVVRALGGAGRTGSPAWPLRWRATEWGPALVADVEWDQ